MGRDRTDSSQRGPAAAEATGTPGAPGVQRTAAGSSSDERLRVLQLVEQGTISPEQAAELLAAMASAPARGGRHSGAPTVSGDDDIEWSHVDYGDAGGASDQVLASREPSRGWAGGAAGTASWLRIRVTDGTGRTTADVKVPLSVVGTALKIGARWVPQLRALDPAWLLATLRLRVGRPVFSFRDAADGDRVVITVE